MRESPYSLRLPADVKKALVREAKAQERPVAYVIVKIVREWIERCEEAEAR